MQKIQSHAKVNTSALILQHKEKIMTEEKRSRVVYNRKFNKFLGLTPEIIAQLKSLYQNIDVDRELIKMALWLSSDAGKARKGSIGFIMSWLERALPVPLTPEQRQSAIQGDNELGRCLQDYLTSLWKNREHLLEFNTIRR